MNHYRAIFLALLLVLIASSGYAFDGQRKGFVLGMGAGYAPLMTGERNDPPMDFDDKDGLAVNFVIGYSWSNQNQILWLLNGGGYYDTLNVYYEGNLIHENEISFFQGFSGLAYRRYFSPQARSFFVTGGIGIQRWMANEWYACQSGLGFLFGGGYEVTRYLQIEGSFSFGHTSSCNDIDYNHSQLVFTLTGVLY